MLSLFLARTSTMSLVTKAYIEATTQDTKNLNNLKEYYSGSKDDISTIYAPGDLA